MIDQKSIFTNNNHMPYILVVDDQEDICFSIKQALEQAHFKVLTCLTGHQAMEMIKENKISLLLLDLFLEDMDGFELLKWIKQEKRSFPTIIFSGKADIPLAVKAMKQGVVDFLEKPISLAKMVRTCQNVIKMRALEKENKQLKKQQFLKDKMIGSSSSIQELEYKIKQLSHSSANVIIYGENGTGKELVAKYLHDKSKRSCFPFIPVNCAAIPEALIESEFFGYEKGAFTDAQQSKKGFFQLAHQGTLFLDECTDLTLQAQAKLLRALQEKQFYPVGSTQAVDVDIRIISATNKNIRQLIQKGLFREDLFFRLHVISLNVPPLSDRIEDLEALLNYFFDKQGRVNRWSTQALEQLKSYAWPGNIRELKNFVDRIVAMENKNVYIDLPLVNKYLLTDQFSKKNDYFSIYHSLTWTQAKKRFEKKFLVYQLKKHDYNLTKTAQTLGMYPGNLSQKITQLGIVFPNNMKAKGKRDLNSSKDDF